MARESFGNRKEYLCEWDGLVRGGCGARVQQLRDLGGRLALLAIVALRLILRLIYDVWVSAFLFGFCLLRVRARVVAVARPNHADLRGALLVVEAGTRHLTPDLRDLDNGQCVVAVAAIALLPDGLEDIANQRPDVRGFGDELASDGHPLALGHGAPALELAAAAHDLAALVSLCEVSPVRVHGRAAPRFTGLADAVLAPGVAGLRDPLGNEAGQRVDATVDRGHVHGGRRRRRLDPLRLVDRPGLGVRRDEPGAAHLHRERHEAQRHFLREELRGAKSLEHSSLDKREIRVVGYDRVSGAL